MVLNHAICLGTKIELYFLVKVKLHLHGGINKSTGINKSGIGITGINKSKMFIATQTCKKIFLAKNSVIGPSSLR